MSEENYVCEKFVSQRLRKDFCRKCYQSRRLHKNSDGSDGNQGTTDDSSSSAKGATDLVSKLQSSTSLKPIRSTGAISSPVSPKPSRFSSTNPLSSMPEPSPQNTSSSPKPPSPKLPSPKSPLSNPPSPKNPSPKSPLSNPPSPKNPSPKSPLSKPPSPKNPSPKSPLSKPPSPKSPLSNPPSPKSPLSTSPKLNSPLPKPPSPKPKRPSPLATLEAKPPSSKPTSGVKSTSSLIQNKPFTSPPIVKKSNSYTSVGSPTTSKKKSVSFQSVSGCEPMATNMSQSGSGSKPLSTIEQGKGVNLGNEEIKTNIEPNDEVKENVDNCDGGSTAVMDGCVYDGGEKEEDDSFVKSKPLPLAAEELAFIPPPPLLEDIPPPLPLSLVNEGTADIPPPPFLEDIPLPLPPSLVNEESVNIPPPPFEPNDSTSPPLPNDVLADVLPPPAPFQQNGDIPPPPPPPSIRAPPPSQLQRSSGTAKNIAPHPEDHDFNALLAAIREGVSLRHVPFPGARKLKAVDVASELRLKMMKRNKEESKDITALIEEKREEVVKMKDDLVTSAGVHSFPQHHYFLLTRVDNFLNSIELSEEVLRQKLQWPTHLVENLREVVQHLRSLDDRVQAAETLCRETLGLAGQSGRGNKSLVNPEAVKKCVDNVVILSRAMTTDESRYFRAVQSFPVDESSIELFLRRASDALVPLLNLLYEKAFSTYDSVFQPSLTKFDQTFRIQNAIRLLRMCCSLSDELCFHLSTRRHERYSEAQLNHRELSDRLVGGVSEETTELEAVGGARSLVRRVSEGSSRGVMSDELMAELTPAVYTKIEMELLKFALTSGDVTVVDNIIELTKKVYSEDEEALHRFDFDWLLDVVIKNDRDRISYLVKSCGLNINSKSRERDNSLLHRAVKRKDLGMVAFLIRLGAEPLISNIQNVTPVQQLATTCYPQNCFPDNIEDKEPLFSLDYYINNSSLSDVLLISEDGQKFNAHRLVLCAQSSVFKAMLDSDLWEESRNKEVTLPTISAQVLGYLLQYLYTGRCLFPRDDLNLAIDLMGVADQYLLDPMKFQCEQLLSEKIDIEVVIPLYYAARRYNTPRLLANSTHFLLSHYSELVDTDHEVLLHLLENSL